MCVVLSLEVMDDARPTSEAEEMFVQGMGQ